MQCIHIKLHTVYIFLIALTVFPNNLMRIQLLWHIILVKDSLLIFFFYQKYLHFLKAIELHLIKQK